MAAYQGFRTGDQGLPIARIAAPGAIQWETSGEMTLTDIYAVKVDGPSGVNSSNTGNLNPSDDDVRKWRPLGWDVYQPGTGGSTTPVLVAPKNVLGIPPRNGSHPNYPFMRAVSINWSQPDRSSNTWMCEVRYRYSPANRDTTDDQGTQAEPDKQPVKWIEAEFYTHNITVPLSFADNFTPLCTTAGEPITPEPTIAIASPCIRITARNKRSPDRYRNYMGSINDSAITICGIYFPRFCARMTYASRQTEITVGEDSQGNPETEEYYEHTFNIEGNFTPAPAVAGLGDYAGWCRTIPNAGYSFLDANGVLTRAQIQSEKYPDAATDSPLPVPLDAFGHRASSFRIFFNVLPSHPMDWAGLGFPETW